MKINTSHNIPNARQISYEPVPENTIRHKCANNANADIGNTWQEARIPNVATRRMTSVK